MINVQGNLKTAKTVPLCMEFSLKTSEYFECISLNTLNYLLKCNNDFKCFIRVCRVLKWEVGEELVPLIHKYILI